MLLSGSLLQACLPREFPQMWPWANTPCFTEMTTNVHKRTKSHIRLWEPQLLKKTTGDYHEYDTCTPRSNKILMNEGIYTSVSLQTGRCPCVPHCRTSVLRIRMMTAPMRLSRTSSSPLSGICLSSHQQTSIFWLMLLRVGCCFVRTLWSTQKMSTFLQTSYLGYRINSKHFSVGSTRLLERPILMKSEVFENTLREKKWSVKCGLSEWFGLAKNLDSAWDETHRGERQQQGNGSFSQLSL